ncbi:hypothetical protein HNQ80_000063 [Anaerosolibacter carboniphilus]|uniref:Uncharacterized protein n=1 Tax=Anaerosolibacter carboniphilus TaxID=1417629 RepID=A0A841KJE4_9FIRM|nr:hypothetical protein [Anaerosolibacter carboniphilus]
MFAVTRTNGYSEGLEKTTMAKPLNFREISL